MNNPWLGLSKELVYRPGDALDEEPNTRVRLIGKNPHLPKETLAKKAAPVPVQRTVGNPRGPRLKAIANPWCLSGSQCAVMAHLVDGNDTDEIAELLHIARKTVELHLHNIRKAMGVNKTLMAALAWDRFHRPTTHHLAETAQPLAGTGD